MKKFTLFVMAALMSSSLFAQKPLSPKAGVKANMVEKDVENRFGQRMLPNGAKPTGFRMSSHLQSMATSQNRAAKAGEEETVISETPAGRAEAYVKKGFSYLVFWGYVFQTEVTAGVGELVFDDDNSTVYIKNPYYALPTDTWLKGTLKDNKIVVSMPQKIFEEEYDGEVNSFYANKLEYNEDEAWYFLTEGANEISFAKVDGVWYMEDEGAVLGLTDAAGEWVGYGDYGVSYEKFNDVAVAAPDGMPFEKWVMDRGDGSGSFVNVCFNGNDVYIEGLYDGIPDGVVKGQVDGDKAVFNSGQYVGADIDYIYFSAANIENQWDDDYEEYVDDPDYFFDWLWTDDETGMYYLKSCYYQPEICRFISADSYASTGQGILGHNVYCYCGNNPVNAMDPDGKLFKNIKNAMKALTNKVKSAYPMVKRFVKNTFGAYASTKSTFSSPSSKQKTVTGKIKSFFSPFDVQIGSTTSTTCSEHGNRKKRVVGYANFEMKAHIKTATTVVKKGLSKQNM